MSEKDKGESLNGKEKKAKKEKKTRDPNETPEEREERRRRRREKKEKKRQSQEEIKTETHKSEAPPVVKKETPEEEKKKKEDKLREFREKKEKEFQDKASKNSPSMDVKSNNSNNASQTTPKKLAIPSLFESKHQSQPPPQKREMEKPIASQKVEKEEKQEKKEETKEENPPKRLLQKSEGSADQWWISPDRVGFAKIEAGGVFSKGWKEKYLCLKHNTLYFFEDPQKKAPTRSVVLDWATFTYTSASQVEFTITFQPWNPNEKDIVLRCKTEQELREWLTSMRRAKYLYAKNTFGIEMSLLETKKEDDLTNPSHARALEKFKNFFGKGDNKEQAKLVSNLANRFESSTKTKSPLVFEKDSDRNLIKVESTDTQIVKYSIKYATISKLIEKLCDDKVTTTNYIQAFVLTFHSFTTPLELLTGLIELWNRNLPKQDSEDKTIPPALLRISQVLKKWIEDNFFDFLESVPLTTALLNFVETQMVKGKFEKLKKPGETLKTALNKKLNPKTYDNTERYKTAPEPELPFGFEDQAFNFLDISNIELARQITLYSFSLFSQIPPREFLGQKWNKTNKLEVAPRISAFIQSFNILSGWVVNCITETEDTIARAEIMIKFIDLAQCLKDIHNFDAMVAIISGFENAGIHRLKHTWNELPENTLQIYEKCKEITKPAGSYKEYRAALKSATGAIVPYLGIHLQDLTFIEDGNKDFNANGLVNFKKRGLLSEAILEIKKYQQQPYTFIPVPEIADYLLCIAPMNSDETYKRSLKLEPRGMEDPTEKKESEKRRNRKSTLRSGALTPEFRKSTGSSAQLLSALEGSNRKSLVLGQSSPSDPSSPPNSPPPLSPTDRRANQGDKKEKRRSIKLF